MGSCEIYVNLLTPNSPPKRWAVIKPYSSFWNIYYWYSQHTSTAGLTRKIEPSIRSNKQALDRGKNGSKKLEHNIWDQTSRVHKITRNHKTIPSSFCLPRISPPYVSMVLPGEFSLINLRSVWKLQFVKLLIQFPIPSPCSGAPYTLFYVHINHFAIIWLKSALITKCNFLLSHCVKGHRLIYIN